MPIARLQRTRQAYAQTIHRQPTPVTVDSACKCQTLEVIGAGVYRCVNCWTIWEDPPQRQDQ